MLPGGGGGADMDVHRFLSIRPRLILFLSSRLQQERFSLFSRCWLLS